tara:strand:+ start:40 stop:300 length:261 start_codon:yes stop_codon:yes gene_type:complete
LVYQLYLEKFRFSIFFEFSSFLNLNFDSCGAIGTSQHYLTPCHDDEDDEDAEKNDEDDEDDDEDGDEDDEDVDEDDGDDNGVSIWS